MGWLIAMSVVSWAALAWMLTRPAGPYPRGPIRSYADALRDPESEEAWYRLHPPLFGNKNTHLIELKRANRARRKR
jgi:hypothetical protein